MELLLRASFFKRYRRCGQATCRCATEGEQGHPGFYLGVTFRGGKTSQVSIPERLVPVARQWIENYHQLWERIEEISAINLELLRQRWTDAEDSPKPKAKSERHASASRSSTGRKRRSSKSGGKN